MNRRPRVLVIAEAANPQWVSVPLVGWSIANALRSVAEVHLVTQVRNRDAIVRAGLVEGRDFTAIDTEPLMRPLWKLASALGGSSGKAWTAVTAIQSLAYPYFERLVWKQFGQRIRSGDFKIVHRVTPLSPTAPSRLAGHCAKAGIPFLLGPLNGGIPWPKEFDRERRKEREWLSYVRCAYKLMPGIGATWRNASAIIAASCHTRSELPAAAQRKTIYIPENAIDPRAFAAPFDAKRYDYLNLCFIGRLVPYKGPDIAIEAAAPLLRSGRATLTMIGDGPMMGELRQLAKALGVSEAVEFRGWVQHADVPDATRGSSVFLFPSVREFGGGAVIEAMALGLVPIVMNYGGPGEIVTDGTGFRIPMGPRDETVASITALLERLALDPRGLQILATNALTRVQQFYTWDRKAEQLLEVYEWVLGNRVNQPDFGFLKGN